MVAATIGQQDGYWTPQMGGPRALESFLSLASGMQCDSAGIAPGPRKFSQAVRRMGKAGQGVRLATEQAPGRESAGCGVRCSSPSDCCASSPYLCLC